MSKRNTAGILFAITVALILAAGYAFSAYESARAEWVGLSASLGEPEYDAPASDAAYARAEALLPWVGWSANAAAVGLIALALGLGALAPPASRLGVTDDKLFAATLIDTVALIVAAIPSWLVVRSDPGLTLLVTRLFPAVAVAWITVGAASGRTLGARAVRLSLGTPPGASVGLRILFAQPILLVVPFLLLPILAQRARRQRPPVRWLAPHLALAQVPLPG